MCAGGFPVEGDGDAAAKIDVSRKSLAGSSTTRDTALWTGRLSKMDRLLPFRQRHEIALRRAVIDLPRAGDLLRCREVHFTPVGDPARQTAQGEQHRKHLDRETHCSVDDARIEIDVRIEFPLDEVWVAEGRGFEFLG